MDPLKQASEHHISVQDVQHQHKKITKEQERILFQVSLANVLLFHAGRLDPEQQHLQDQLQQEYFQGLHVGDTVDIGCIGAMGKDTGIVLTNDGSIIKTQNPYNYNERKEHGVRFFSAMDGYSIGPLINKDIWEDTEPPQFYIDLPEAYTIKSTDGIPKEALDELIEIYKQAGNETTCYDLVNTLKYGNTSDDVDDFIF